MKLQKKVMINVKNAQLERQFAKLINFRMKKALIFAEKDLKACIVMIFRERVYVIADKTGTISFYQKLRMFSDKV